MTAIQLASCGGEPGGAFSGAIHRTGQRRDDPDRSNQVEERAGLGRCFADGLLFILYSANRMAGYAPFLPIRHEMRSLIGVWNAAHYSAFVTSLPEFVPEYRTRHALYSVQNHRLQDVCPAPFGVMKSFDFSFTVPYNLFV
jgi:hypothetical protein